MPKTNTTTNAFEIYPEVENGFLKFEGSYKDYDILISGNNIKATDLRPQGFGTHTYYEKIHKFGFDDIKEINVLARNPYHVTDTLAFNGNSLEINSSELLKNDKDFHGSKLSIYKVFDAVGGEVDLRGNNIHFVADPFYQGPRSFKYNIKNEAGYFNTKGITVHLHEPKYPNDPDFLKQWHFFDSNILTAWNEYKGKGINIAVYDQGFIPSHDDLEINQTPYRMHYDIPGYHFGQHALMVSGVIGAKANNNLGLTGISPEASITTFQIPFNDIKKINFNFAKDFDIINNSWSLIFFTLNNNATVPFEQEFKAQIDDAIIQGRDGKGSIIVFASGNYYDYNLDTNLGIPQNSPFIINVGGYIKPENLLEYEEATSDFPSRSSNVLISAPASHIPGLYSSNMNFLNNALEFHHDKLGVSGTSFSAPIVSGIIALMLEANPNLGFRDVQDILAYSALPSFYDGETIFINSAINSNGGGLLYNIHHGFGKVDALGAVRLAETWEQQNTFKNLIATFESPEQKNKLLTFLPIPEDQAGRLMSEIALNVKENIEIEQVELYIDAIFASNLQDYEIFLVSPSGSQFPLVSNPGASSLMDLSFIDNNIIKWNFAIQHARGELSQGVWKLQIIESPNATNTSNPSFLKSINLLNAIGLNFYGKDIDSTSNEMIFTKTFGNELLFDSPLPQEYIDQRQLLTNSHLDTINTVAIDSNVEINLSSSSPSKIMGKELFFETDHSYLNIKTGDGDDVITGNHYDNIIMPGRGNDIITTGLGNDIIWIPNTNWQNLGTKTIIDFDIKHDKIRIDNINAYEDILVNMHQSGKDTIITINNLILELEDIIPSELSNGNFILCTSMLVDV